MKLTFNGDATELIFLVKRIQEIRNDESLEKSIVEQLPKALYNALYGNNDQESLDIHS